MSDQDGLLPPPPMVHAEASDSWTRPRGVTALVVGICGGTSSGKTTFSRALIETLRASDPRVDPVLVRQDEYFQDFRHLPEDARPAARTANRPDAIAWPALREALTLLKQGKSTPFPGRGTGMAQRVPEVREVGPTRLVIAEGHLLFVDAPIHALLDVKVFLDCDVEERVLRRIKRDTTTSGRTIEQSLEWFLRDVQPNNQHYTDWQRRQADIVIPHDRPNPVATALLADAIRFRLAQA